MIVIKCLGKSEKINDKRVIFNELCRANKYKTYNNYHFLNEIFVDKIDIKQYAVFDKKPKSFFDTCENLIPENKIYEEYTQDDLYIQDYEIKTFDIIYNFLSEKHTVELFKIMRGLFDIDTKVYMYIKEENAVIVHSWLSCEDILNLLSIEGLKVYIYRFENHFYHCSLSVYNLSINKTTFGLLKKELQNQKESIKRIKQKIKNISPSYPKERYLNLDDKELAIKMYSSFSEDDKRTLQSLLLNTNGVEAIKLVSDYEPLLNILKKDILLVDLLIQSYRNLLEYINTISVMLIGNHMNTFERSIRVHKQTRSFEEYKILTKDFNKKYRDLNKFIKRWIPTVKNNTKVVQYSPNKNGQYYMIAEELASKLSKLWFVSEVILFGSVSKGLESEGSDIDIIFKVGIDLKELTLSRRETMYKIIECEARKIEKKYPELSEAQLNKKYGNDTIRKCYAKLKLFNFLPIQFQKKKYLKLYEDAGFLDSSITLFKKDFFFVNYDSLFENRNFNKIDYVLFPTDQLYSFIINKVWENDEAICLEYIKFNYIGDTYSVEYIAQQIVDKNRGFRVFKIDLRFPSIFSDNHHASELEEEEYLIKHEIDKGCIRKVNPNVNYIEKLMYRTYMID